MRELGEARTIEECQRIVESCAGDYPLCLSWQSCLEPLLPPLPTEVVVNGQRLRRCLAFFVDEELGPHFVFDDAEGLIEVKLSEVPFAEPLSPAARLWLRAFGAWRRGQDERARRVMHCV